MSLSRRRVLKLAAGGAIVMVACDDDERPTATPGPSADDGGLSDGGDASVPSSGDAGADGTTADADTKPAFVPPYTLPSPGGKRELVVAGGARLLMDAKPAWFGGGEWGYSTMNAYGAGAFTPELGDAGAYVLAGQGGHNSPMLPGFVAFDFASGTWKPYVASKDKDGKDFEPQRVLPDIANDTEIIVDPTSGRDDREVVGYVEHPAPDHTYQLQHVPPRAVTGGTLTFVRTVTTAVSNAATSGSRSHGLALEGPNVGRWSRASKNRMREIMSADPFTEGVSAYDPIDKRIYFPIQFPGYWELPYLDLTDGTWKKWFVKEAEFAGIAGSPRSAFVDVQRRVLVVITATHVAYLDLTATDNRAWVKATTSGTMPHGDGAVTKQGFRGRWDKYPVADGGDDCWYALWGRGTRTNAADTTDKEKAYQQYLWRLKIPATLDGTWELSTFTPTTEDGSGGITAAREQDFENGGGIHYTRFFYVPALKCFAWIPRPDSNVELIKPSV